MRGIVSSTAVYLVDVNREDELVQVEQVQLVVAAEQQSSRSGNRSTHEIDRIGVSLLLRCSKSF